MFFLQLRFKGLGKTSSVGPFFSELLMSVYVKDLVCFYSKVLK